MKRLVVGIIGAGRVAAVHLAGFQRLPNVTVAMVADIREPAAEKLAEHCGARTTADYRELLGQQEIDAVDIVLPHDLHAEAAEAALHAGKHVFMDKPLATTVADGERLCKLAATSDRTVMICHNYLFHPAVMRTKAVIDSGVLGQPTVVDAWSCGHLDLPPWDFRLSRAATGGGAWVDGGSHLLYTLEHFLGPIDRVRAEPSAGQSRMEGEDRVAATVRFESGTVGSIRISYAERSVNAPWPAGWQMGYELRGTAGAVRLDVTPEPVLTVDDGTSAGPIRITSRFEESFKAAIAEFVSATVDGREPRVPPTASLRTLRQLLGATDGQ